MTVETSAAAFYRIGTPGRAWGEAERAEWKAQTKKHRSYQDEVVQKLEALKEVFDVEQYGSLSHGTYPLYALKSKSWAPDKPHVLVTGGVHGYETSGVQGALLFCKTKAGAYVDKCNIVVIPCVSPWAYEHIQRWNADILDPNRSFEGEGTTEESRALIFFLKSLNVLQQQWSCHVDLHETTDTDESEFMPAKAAEAGQHTYESEPIPDGFYLVANSVNPQPEWHAAIRESVRQVTHVAPPDKDGLIIGEPIAQEGVIQVPSSDLGLCMSLTNAKYATTTEVYPDSPKATDEICNDAQVAAITGAIDAMLSM
mmetsp:Transcript_6394/g.10603  ORF Transcript_6394/g.10603 Transcript_6394/m.10603 type:complete len:312 (-) Transcript_6394:12-947(-)